MSSSSTYATTTSRRQQTWSNQHQLRKQRSFIESTAAASRILCQATAESCRGGRRSGSLILARQQPTDRSKLSYLQKQRTVGDQVCFGGIGRGRSEQRSRGYALSSAPRRFAEGGGGGAGGAVTGGGVKLAWTSSVIDGDDGSEISARRTNAGSLLGSKQDGVGRSFDRLKKSSSKSDNKINLSIVLSQTIKATENETINSDIDSSSESADTAGLNPPQQSVEKKSSSEILSRKPTGATATAAQRRAQFQFGRGDQITPPTVIQTIPSNTIVLSSPTSLTVRQRPPLVRAMSAPVRSLDDTTKNIFANNKRKTRRRKIITRNSSCDKGEIEPGAGTGLNGKKVLSRSRSTISSDVITLVSLISSEGSDSEKEDSASAEESQTARAPSLRKTGKSVSFQENDQPTYQMAVKAFPHLLRRGSIAPLAARLRSNRPPTAPPVSIFLSDYENCSSVKRPEMEKISSKDDLATTGKENSVFMNNNNSSTTEEPVVDCVFPGYVRSLKERECWKLFQKMSKKGVNITYDTVLRGMLTPTEFRQLQKQREYEAAKAKEVEDAEAAAKEEAKIQGKKSSHCTS